MNRRAFLKAIATIGAAAAIPSTLIPKWKAREPQFLYFRGVPVRYDPACPANRVYFLNRDGIWLVEGQEQTVQTFLAEGRVHTVTEKARRLGTIIDMT